MAAPASGRMPPPQAHDFRAFELLAAGLDGCTESLMLAHGLWIETADRAGVRQACDRDHRRIVGRWTASQIVSASAASCLLRFIYAFTYCAGISCTSWPSARNSRAQ